MNTDSSKPTEVGFPVPWGTVDPLALSPKMPYTDFSQTENHMATKKEKEILMGLLEEIEEAWEARHNYLTKHGDTHEGYARATGYGYATIRSIEETIQEMLGLRE